MRLGKVPATAVLVLAAAGCTVSSYAAMTAKSVDDDSVKFDIQVDDQPLK